MKKLFAVLSVFFLPFLAQAHEVYVLTPEEIDHAIATPAFSMMDTLFADLHLFAFWAFIGILVVIAVFLISISRVLERLLYPWLNSLRPYAPLIARITVGISFLAAAIFQAAYGPELPLQSFWGEYTPLITVILVAMGLCVTFGFLTRYAALAALILFGINTYAHGLYMLTYTNYLGEIIVLLILGAHAFSVDTFLKKKPLPKIVRNLETRIAPLSFLILRVSFGISLLYAAIYAKLLHNNLALDVASLPLAGHMYGVAHYLGFEPHFLVLGAFIVEVVIALFFILGLEIRFTALFLEFWLSLSLIYFGEVVWPHIVLIGIPIAFIFYGYDKYSLEGLFFKKRTREPIL